MIISRVPTMLTRRMSPIHKPISSHRVTRLTHNTPHTTQYQVPSQIDIMKEMTNFKISISKESAVLEIKLSEKIAGVETKLSEKFTRDLAGVETKLSDKIAGVETKLSEKISKSHSDLSEKISKSHSELMVAIQSQNTKQEAFKRRIYSMIVLGITGCVGYVERNRLIGLITPAIKP